MKDLSEEKAHGFAQERRSMFLNGEETMACVCGDLEAMVRDGSKGT